MKAETTFDMDFQTQKLIYDPIKNIQMFSQCDYCFDHVREDIWHLLFEDRVGDTQISPSKSEVDLAL